MGNDVKDVIAALEGKVAEYEGILEEVLQKPTTLGRVQAGPFVDERGQNYRINDGGASRLVLFKRSLLFDKSVTTLREGTEVICLGSVIIGVVPEPLMAKPEPIEFDRIGWEHVGGLSSQLDQIRETIDAMLTDEKTRKEFGLEPMKGMLLYGPPGCGKTLIARVIASQMLGGREATDESFTYLKGGELLEPLVGLAESNIKGFFDRGRKYFKKTGIRSVMFLDEAEAILPARGSRRSSDVDKTIVPTFLAEMDGIEPGNPFVILSSNLPKEIDSAILREGRIDLKVEITRPTRNDAEDIFKIHLNKVKCADVPDNLAAIGANIIFNTPDLKARVSGALIETVVKSAVNKAVARKRSQPAIKAGVIADDIALSITQL